MLTTYKNWFGNIDDLRTTAHEIIEKNKIENAVEIYSVRLIRDYVSRGLLGVVRKAGKELLFEYEQLLRFVAVRVMITDGWSLGKIQEQLALSSLLEIEDLLPPENKRALDTVERLRASAKSERRLSARAASSMPQPLSSDERMPKPIFNESWSDESISEFSLSERLSKRAKETNSIRREMREALSKLNISGDGPAIEDLKLIALAPWCKVLLTDERFLRLTVQEAKDLGNALTASLTAKILQRGSGQ